MVNVMPVAYAVTYIFGTGRTRMVTAIFATLLQDYHEKPVCCWKGTTREQRFCAAACPASACKITGHFAQEKRLRTLVHWGAVF